MRTSGIERREGFQSACRLAVKRGPGKAGGNRAHLCQDRPARPVHGGRRYTERKLAGCAMDRPRHPAPRLPGPGRRIQPTGQTTLPRLRRSSVLKDPPPLMPRPPHATARPVAARPRRAGCRRHAPDDPPEPVGPAWFADVTDAKQLNFGTTPARSTGGTSCPRSWAPAAPSSTSTATAGSTSTWSTTAGRSGKTQPAVPPAARRHVPGRQRRLRPGRRRPRHGRRRRRRQQRRPARRAGDRSTAACRLFLNQGDGTFRDVTEESGLDNPLWGTSAAFFDYDRDGWLDLVVVNYVDYDPSQRLQRPGGQARLLPPQPSSRRP